MTIKEILLSIREAFLSHKVFITAAVIFTVIVLGLLLYPRIRGEAPEPDVRDIMLERHYRSAVAFPLTLYASGFSREQLLELQKAASDWHNATKGTVEINVVSWTPKDRWDDVRYQYYPRYTAWILDGNDPRVARLFVRHSVTMGGVCKGRYIGILKDDAEKHLRLIAKHELGHLMGLEHIRQEYPALMNLKSRGVITRYDLLQFEYLYDR